MSPARLAWSNLRHQRARTLIALVGVCAVVLLVFMQLGFLDSVTRTATLVYDHLDFDLLVVSSEFVNLGAPASFPRARLAQAGAAPDVRSARPLTAIVGLWRRPAPPGGRASEWPIMALGVEPAELPAVLRDPVGRVVRSPEELAAHAALLGRTDLVLIDRSSRREYGSPETWRPGAVYELNGREVVIGGDIKVGIGFGYNGLLLTSEETLARVAGWPRDQVTFGLIKLAPGADRRAARDALTQSLPGDVMVLTREEINARENDYWVSRTAVGQFFVVGVGVALVVGGIFVYQMMATDITRRLPEYATLRALGYWKGFLPRVVFAQGTLLALIGYVPGLLMALVGYEMARYGAGIPIGMTGWRLVLVLGLTVGMCLLSSLVAVRIVQRANPADLF
jgi:putative ABC transport system permease protein